MSFLLQGEEAGSERALLHRTSGLAEAHRLLPQESLRRRQVRARQEEEHEEGRKQGRGRQRRGRVDFGLTPVEGNIEIKPLLVDICSFIFFFVCFVYDMKWRGGVNEESDEVLKAR